MQNSIPNSSGSLGVAHLKRIYERSIAGRRGEFIQRTEVEWRQDNVVLAGLGLPIETTFTYLMQFGPTFEEFEKWIAEQNGGRVDPANIERIDRALAGEPCDAATAKFLQSIDESNDVLTADDLDFWDKNGFVIVRGAISREQARASEIAVWDVLDMSPDDPATWYDRPVGKGIMMEFYHHPALEANRRSPRICKAFAQLWKTSDLWASIDRTSFNPPEQGSYHFQGPHLHWDSSLALPHYFGTQGIIYLCDTPAAQGALRLVPGFHRELPDWLASLPPGTNPREVDLTARAVPVAANAGDLIIWHQALPHGASPNRGVYPRIVQYLNMFPLDRRENMEWV